MNEGLKKIADNETTIQQLLAVKENLVPFIGAGFSCPICPGWGAFLDSYLESVREEFLEVARLSILGARVLIIFTCHLTEDFKQ